MFDFLKKNENSAPDIGKEEEVESKKKVRSSKNDSSDESEETIERPLSRSLPQTISRPFSQPPENAKSSFEIEKMNARLEATNSMIKNFNERFSVLHQQIGELRVMSLANEKNLSASNLDARKAVEVVKEIKPEKLRFDYQKIDARVNAIREYSGANRQFMNTVMEELKALKRKAGLFEGTDAILRLNSEIKKDLFETKKMSSRVEMNADKSEQIFIELRKKFQENQKLYETVVTLEGSYFRLKKEFEKLRLDYERILSVDDFNNFGKKVENRLMVLENTFPDVEGIKERNDRLAKIIERILLMTKRNETDIANLGLKKGDRNVKRISDYEQKLFSLLEIVDKITLEIGKIKKKVGIKTVTSPEKVASPNDSKLEKLESVSKTNKKDSIEEKMTEDEKKINDLLLSGKSYLAKNDLEKAKKIYKEIFDSYNLSGSKDELIYPKIVKFYNDMSNLTKKPGLMPPKNKEESKNLPPINNQKYKKLSDY